MIVLYSKQESLQPASPLRGTHCGKYNIKANLKSICPFPLQHNCIFIKSYPSRQIGVSYFTGRGKETGTPLVGERMSAQEAVWTIWRRQIFGNTNRIRTPVPAARLKILVTCGWKRFRTKAQKTLLSYIISENFFNCRLCSTLLQILPLRHISINIIHFVQETVLLLSASSGII